MFYFITGGTIINPSYTDWILAKGDPSTHYLGWEFFRSTPMFQWPLGANLNYGLGNSIVYSDSIPLFAFIFKPFSNLLPLPFQYIGVWILLCFILQSFFSWKLLTLITQNKALPLIGSVFFLLAPVYLLRSGGHYALMGHWVLIAAIYLYFSTRFSFNRWIVLITLTSLIHAYLLILVLIIWGTDLFQRNLLKELTIKKTIVTFIMTSIYTVLIMWSIGYFMFGLGEGISGFGYFKMNIYSLFDSNGIWSKTIPDLKGRKGDGEGFNFLGIGMIALIFPVFLQIIRKQIFIYKEKFIPIFFTSIILILYAISNKISIGSNEIFSYAIPELIKPITTTFRVSGRFFWPVYYLIYLVIFYAVFKFKNKKLITFVCLILISLQIWDTNKLFNMYRDSYINPKQFSSAIKSPTWKDIANNYTEIIYVQPKNQPKNWKSLAKYAMENNLSINIGYFARINKNEQVRNKQQIKNNITNNTLNKKAIYVFDDNHLWNIAISQLHENDIAGTIDGFRVLLPAYKTCKTCKINHKKDIKLVGVKELFKINDKKINFKTNESGSKHLLTGWSKVMPWGVWSDGDSSTLRIDISKTVKDKVSIIIEGRAYMSKEQFHQEIEIFINNYNIGFLKYSIYQNTKFQTLVIPKKIIDASNGRLLIKLKHSHPISPSENSSSRDSRKLSLGLISIALKY